MTKTITISSKNRLMPGPSGMGAKVVQGHFSMLPSDNALHVTDLELNTINALFIEQRNLGTFIAVDLIASGTYDNLASLNAYNLGTGAAPNQITGTRTGSAFSGRFIAFGE